MATEARGRGLPAAAGVALVAANARYWPTVHPRVCRELRRWEAAARAIPDLRLRAQAQRKLRAERFNSEVAATLATLAPRARRDTVVTAIVALEVMYDYLDGLTEQPVGAPLANGRLLYGAFADALTADAVRAEDRYRLHPGDDDGGYLAALAGVCREALWSLPAAAAVAPAARRAAARCGEAQTRTHAVWQTGHGQLAVWAREQPEAGELRWWEVASGAAASVLAVHALIAAAADPRTTAREAERIADAYLSLCALTTLLDSLVDEAEDADGGHAYLAYYRDEAEAAQRLGRLAAHAVASAARLPRAEHHLMTVAGAVAFYLSAPAAREARARRIAAPATAELQPLIAPALALFGAWRGAKRSGVHEIARRRGTWGPCTPSPRFRPAPRRAAPPAPPAARSGAGSSATGSNSAPPAYAR